jgi:hypothetical protein
MKSLKMVKTCAFGHCRSDTRKEPSLVFIPFPKPKTNFQRAKRWAHLCGRSNFGVKNIKKGMYVCEKHFPSGVDLDLHSNLDLEPFPAHSEDIHRQRSLKNRRGTIAPVLSLESNLALNLKLNYSKSTVKSPSSSKLMMDKCTSTADAFEPIDVSRKF